MRAKFINEYERKGASPVGIGVGISSMPEKYILSLLEPLLPKLNAEHQFIKFDVIEVKAANSIKIKYLSPIAGTKYMNTEIYFGEKKGEFVLAFEIGKYSGGVSFAEWKPSFNRDKDAQNIIDAMNLWGWHNAKNSFPKPSSYIWEEDRRRRQEQRDKLKP